MKRYYNSRPRNTKTKQTRRDQPILTINELRLFKHVVIVKQSILNDQRSTAGIGNMGDMGYA